MILTDEEIQTIVDDAFARWQELGITSNRAVGETIAKAQLKKVVDDAFERGAIGRVKSKHNFPDHIEVDLIRLQEFLVALLEEVK